jgi:quinol monooxygenase YgiN
LSDPGRLLATPNLLEGKVKLENAVPVAGFVTRSDTPEIDHEHEYIRSGKLRVRPGELERVEEIIKSEIPSFFASESGILSFVAMRSLDEVDTIFTWERYSSRAEFDRYMGEGGILSNFMQKINSLVDVEGMTGYRAADGYVAR